MSDTNGGEPATRQDLLDVGARLCGRLCADADAPDLSTRAGIQGFGDRPVAEFRKMARLTDQRLQRIEFSHATTDARLAGLEGRVLTLEPNAGSKE